MIDWRQVYQKDLCQLGDIANLVVDVAPKKEVLVKNQSS